jgi:hypothetical protein
MRTEIEDYVLKDMQRRLVAHRLAARWIGAGLGTFLLLVLAVMYGCPAWTVYDQRKAGEAALARAQSQKMTLVTQAEAEKEAASRRAEAIRIVGQASRDFPQYRQQEFIGAFAEALQGGKIQQIIYVPTEANIPIIEAGRLAEQAAKKDK